MAVWGSLTHLQILKRNKFKKKTKKKKKRNIIVLKIPQAKKMDGLLVNCPKWKADFLFFIEDIKSIAVVQYNLQVFDQVRHKNLLAKFPAFGYKPTK